MFKCIIYRRFGTLLGTCWDFAEEERFLLGRRYIENSMLCVYRKRVYNYRISGSPHYKTCRVVESSLSTKDTRLVLLAIYRFRINTIFKCIEILSRLLLNRGSSASVSF